MSLFRKIVRGFVLLLVLGGLYMVAQLFWPAPRVVVSRETTWLTEPLADDGLPDYAGYLLEQGREGVTAENNGAIPYLQAMWPAGLESRHQQPLCEHLGMEVPDSPGMYDPLESEEFQERARAWLQPQFAADAGTPEEEEHRGEEDEEGVITEVIPEDFEAEDTELVEDALLDLSTDEPMEERLEELFEAVQNRPWRRDELLPLAEWIDEHAREYALVHEAAHRPRFYLPSPSYIVDPGDMLVHAVTPAIDVRYAVRCLALRGYLLLGEGDAAAAWRDCEAIYRLAAQVHDDCLVSLLVGTGIELYASDLYLAILESPALTREIARQMLNFHLERPKGRDLVAAIESYERFSFLSAMIVFSRQRTGGEALEAELEPRDPTGLPVRVAIDWNTSMRMGNEWFDKLAEVARMKDRAKRKDALEKWSSEIDELKAKFPMNIASAVVRRGARNRVMGEYMVGLLLPGVEAAFAMEDRSLAYAHLDPVAAALAIYRLERGVYPDTLVQLVPDILSSWPIDSYGRQVAYRLTDTGYLVYTTGANGFDDDGSNAFPMVFEGYEIEEDEAPARRALGLPPLDPDSDEPVGATAGENSAPRSLAEQVGRDDDDFAIRLPTLDSPLFSAPPAEE